MAINKSLTAQSTWTGLLTFLNDAHLTRRSDHDAANNAAQVKRRTVGKKNEMNRQTILKSLGYVTVAMCLLGLGFFWGYRNGLVAGGFSASMAELQLSGDGMALQMNEGTCETVKKTINAHFVFMDKYKGKNKLIMPNHTYNADKFLGHMRLFLVERHECNTIETDKQLKAAASACTQAEMMDCSESNILHIAEELNKRQTMKCLSTRK